LIRDDGCLAVRERCGRVRRIAIDGWTKNPRREIEQVPIAIDAHRHERMIGASDDDETPAVPNGGNAARILAADRSAVDRRRIEKREVAIEAHEEDPIPFEPRNEM